MARPRILTEAELNRIWAALETTCSPAYAGVVICAATGARPAEAVLVKWRDWPGQEVIAVPTLKAGAQEYRLISLHAVAVRWLQRYAIWWHSRSPLDEQHAARFPLASVPSTQIAVTTRALRHACAQLARRSRVDDLHLYAFRHTAAVRIAQSYGIGAVQTLLGHLSPKSSLRYARIAAPSVSAIADALKPTVPPTAQ